MKIPNILTLAVVFVLVGAVGALAPVQGAVANSKQLEKLPGRWKGSGSVSFDGGTKEAIKCIATYFLKEQGKTLLQNLRCATLASYKISAKSALTVSGGKLLGTWTEQNTGNDGAVKGSVTAEGFKLNVTGATFRADMLVKVDGSCAHSIDIAPSGLGVKHITIALRKC